MEWHANILGISRGDWLGYVLLGVFAASLIICLIRDALAWLWDHLKGSSSDVSKSPRPVIEEPIHAPERQATVVEPIPTVRTWPTMAALIRDHQPDIVAISLQSGSNGNCYYVQGGGTGIIIDAGISGVRAQQRLAQFGIDIRSARALLISHDHHDHVFAAGIYHRKFGLPVFMTRRTLIAARSCAKLGRFNDVQFFEPGETLKIGCLHIETLPTPHDGVEGVAFVVNYCLKRLGILTDLGHTFDGLKAVVRSLDAMFLESNYDPHMLRAGRYSRELQSRITGHRGHLSNQESADLLASVGGTKLKWVCLAHLSGENNSPDLALATHRKVVPRSLPLLVASRHEPVGILDV